MAKRSRSEERYVETREALGEKLQRHADEIHGPLADAEFVGLSVQVQPELFGFGLERTPDGYRAVKVSTRGKVERIGPKKSDGTHRAESKALALSRMFEAMQAELAPPTKMRFR